MIQPSQPNQLLSPKKMNSESFSVFDPFDLNSSDFNCDLYMNKVGFDFDFDFTNSKLTLTLNTLSLSNQLLKECDISKLMENEQSLYKNIQSLDSEMQTLVYENYNKFINATDTIKKMGTNFDLMEDELSLLSEKMRKITESSEEISKNLKTKRQDLTKLANKHTVLQKLQFLFDLNPKMVSAINRKEFTEAVRYYLSAKNALDRYENFPSIKTIKDECHATLLQLKTILNEQLKAFELNQQAQIAEYIELLLQINEPPENLVDQYLLYADSTLNKTLDNLDYHTAFLTDYYKSATAQEADMQHEMVPMDILEFIDLACNSYLTCLTETVISYEDIFIKSNSDYFTADDQMLIKKKLERFVQSTMSRFFEKVSYRYEADRSSLDEIHFYIQSMDRFYRRLANLESVYYLHRYSKNYAVRIVEEACDCLFNNVAELIRADFADQIMRCRTELAADKPNLVELLGRVETCLDDKFKFIIESLVNFNNPKLSFYRNANLREKIAVKIREKIFVFALNFILTHVESEYLQAAHEAPAQLMLIFTRLLIDLETQIIVSLLANADRELQIEKRDSDYILTTDYELRERAKALSQKLINKYVSRQGQSISCLIRKCIESNEWLATVEPKSVKSIMRTIIDEIAVIDSEVGQLFEEGARTDRSSDSSKRRQFGGTSQLPGYGGKPVYTSKSNWNYARGAKKIDNNLLSNIQKLFSERIEIFADCDFNKLSVTTGIIKIVLKTFIECVRLCSFSRFGFQQIQIDATYLQNQLWRFVTDENLIINLTEEIILSAYQRSFDPIKMESALVDRICEST